ncbi:MAG TPA: hemerythrin domain-containing protein [Candidatus Coprenecus stercoravium]|uniref:Hemerythrin domain-containing protein n=1 Tax=Candidatus Coprenecus stercoravium TaxID=2840735 RepID=A0A9D2K8P4_9BACT|nr:hemerythrin domain-containing protein [Candidatus Coprenecus stercoravium]
MRKNMKMADLLGSDYRLLTVLHRLGIKLGFGERTVEEICLENGVNCDTFLLIANVYATEGYVPSPGLITAASAIDLVKYLHASHAYYLDHELKELDKLFSGLLLPCSEVQRNVIMKFFSDYKNEVRNHFAYEEDIVFPYVRSIAEGKRMDGYSIETFEENHNNIDEKLNDLRNIVMKYLPPACDTVTAIKALSRLCSLEYDLEKHTLIENSILIPMVNRLEEKCQ